MIYPIILITHIGLLVYAALEYRIRQAFKNQKQTFPNQKAKFIDNPSRGFLFLISTEGGWMLPFFLQFLGNDIGDKSSIFPFVTMDGVYYMILSLYV